MYFILSKVLLFLLFPLNWIIVCLLIAVFTRKVKLKRRCFIAGVAMLIIFSNPWLIYLFAKNWDIDAVPLEKGRTYSTVIVLGGFSGDDKNGEGFFNESADRFIQGVKLKEQGVASHILISSGNGNLYASSFREAVWVKGVLKQFNLPDSAILIEQNSRNTFENADFSKQLLLNKHLAPPYLLVTSSWHMRRSQYIFKKEGMDVIPYPSGPISGNRRLGVIDYIMPDAGALVDWNKYLKELVGFIIAHLK